MQLKMKIENIALSSEIWGLLDAMPTLGQPREVLLGALVMRGLVDLSKDMAAMTDGSATFEDIAKKFQVPLEEAKRIQEAVKKGKTSGLYDVGI